MLEKLKEDQIWTGAVILLYTLPFFLWIAATMNAMGPSNSWTMFAIGLLMALAGSAALIMLKRPAPQALPKTGDELPTLPESPSLPAHSLPLPADPELGQLRSKLDELQDQALELQKVQDENTALKNQNFQVIHAYNSLKKEMEEGQSRAESINPETEAFIEKQKEMISQSHEHIAELENRIEEMKYEMRALMNLNESDLDDHLSEDEILRSSR